MSTKNKFTTPVGRLVQGSVYVGQTTDAENRPLVFKTGDKAGQPRVNYWFALAIPKGSEKHWNETVWGNLIWSVGQLAFPNGQANSPNFAWKVVDGDSTIPNSKGTKPCDCEGFAGNWVLKYGSSYAPSLWNSDGTLPLTNPDEIQLGDFIQVHGYVVDNGSIQQPGIHLNHEMIARSAFGQRIVVGADPKTVGFGSAALPAGASSVPIAAAFNSAPAIPTAAPITPPVPVSPPLAEPYPGILVPAAPAPIRVMLPKAEGATYEDLISVGWTDALLIQHGMMQA